MVMNHDGTQGEDICRIPVFNILWADRCRRILGVLMFLACVGMFGCASTPQSPPAPTKQEIRNDADRFFEKLEKENMSEQDRSTR